MIDSNVTARHLKGCPATILIALIFSGRAMGEKDLRLATGYGRATTYDSLATLEAAGLVRKVGKRWALPATFARFFSGSFSESRPPTPPNATATAIHPGDDSSKQQAAENRTIARLLITAGIGRRSPKLQAILDAGLDAAFVRAHVEAWQTQRATGEDVGVGLLITRLLDGDPAPTAPAPPVEDDYVTRIMEIYGTAGAGIVR